MLRIGAQFAGVVLAFLVSAPCMAGPLEDAALAQSRNDYPAAVKIWRDLAAHGDAVAEYRLGRAYKWGRGVAQSDAEAFKWYRLAAMRGNSDADNELGWAYEFGRGAPKSDAEAIRWFRNSALLNNPVGQDALAYFYSTGTGVKKDSAKAATLFRSAADQGFVVAQINLAQMYLSGEGVPKDVALARSWYQKAADQGDALAEFNLGVACFYGYGGPKDFTLAMKSYRAAADQGEPKGMLAVGTMYADGDGVPPDPAEAYKWMSLADEYIDGSFDKSFASSRGAITKQRDEQGAKLTAEQRAKIDRVILDWTPAPLLWAVIPSQADFVKFYPQAAKDVGKEGVVQLSCSVDVAGLLEGCIVVSEDPPHFGFGDAALALARLMKMQPKTRDGRFVDGEVILLPVRFVLPG